MARTPGPPAETPGRSAETPGRSAETPTPTGPADIQDIPGGIEDDGDRLSARWFSSPVMDITELPPTSLDAPSTAGIPFFPPVTPGPAGTARPPVPATPFNTAMRTIHSDLGMLFYIPKAEH